MIRLITRLAAKHLSRKAHAEQRAHRKDVKATTNAMRAHLGLEGRI